MGQRRRATSGVTVALIITALLAAGAILLVSPATGNDSDARRLVVRSVQSRSERDASTPSRPPRMDASTPRREGSVGSTGEPLQTNGGTPFVPNQLVLTFRPGTLDETKTQVRSRLNARLLDRLPLGNELVSIPDQDLEAARAAATAHPAVAYAEPNYIYEITRTPNDPNFKQQWGLDNDGQSILGMTGKVDADIDASEAWEVSTGSADIRVAVVDTGVAHDHPDLAPNIWINPGESGAGKETNGLDDDGNGYVDDWRGWDWVEGDNDPVDVHGHGTHVAGTVGAAGSDGRGISGVNWDVGLVPLRALSVNGLGTSATISSAFAYAGEQGIEIVNASFGGGAKSQTVADTIARYPNTLFVVAAGNDASDNDAAPMYPCNYPAENLICVASTTSGDRLSRSSNYGRTSVDLGAPGSRILSTVPKFVDRFVETFETDVSGRWSTEDSRWARVQDASGTFLAHGPREALTGASDSFAATSVPIDLSGHRGCHLRYNLRLGMTTGRDALRVEGSVDRQSWQKIAALSGTTSGRWIARNDRLPAFDGSATLFLRFRLITTDESQGANADIDDVRVRCLSPTPSNNYSYQSGTSMAAPHVAGAAALVWATAETPSAIVIKNALLTGANKRPGLAGKVTTGARLNVNGALKRVELGDERASTPVTATATVETGPEPMNIETTATPDPSITPTASSSVTDPGPAPSESPGVPTPSASPSPSV